MVTPLSVVKGKGTQKTGKVSLYCGETLFYENPIGLEDAFNYLEFEFNLEEFIFIFILI